MKGKWGILGVALGLALAGTFAAGRQTPGEGRYQGVGVVRADDIPYPPNAGTAGMVTLDVSVDASGMVQKMAVLRDVPPLTRAAEDSVKGWKFSPAAKGGPVGGVVRVNVVFNPFNPANVSIPNPPLPTPENSRADVTGVFRPPDVKTATYGVYPPNTVASGTVVLNAEVAKDGSMAGVRVLRGMGPLSAAATKAIREWTFTPGTYEGKALESHEVVAFVFPAPETGRP